MFLSPVAAQLYEEGKFEELKKLPLDQLLDTNSCFKLQNGRFIEGPAPVSQASPLMSIGGPSVAEDPVSLGILIDPVVISSGHILSRATVNALLATGGCCPLTRQAIDPNRIIELPQINQALALWRLEKTAESLIGNNGQLGLIVKVSGNKIRILLNGEAQQPLHAYLKQLFSGKNNEIVDCPGYSAEHLSFVWRVADKETRLEFWFEPAKMPATFSEAPDFYINNMIQALLKPLNLPPCNDPMEMKTMARLKEREYVTAVPNIELSVKQAGDCLQGFIEHVSAVRQDLAGGYTITDKVNLSHAAPKGQRVEHAGVYGLGFRAPLFNAASNGPASSSSGFRSALTSTQGARATPFSSN